jgi:hypothetical protein
VSSRKKNRRGTIKKSHRKSSIQRKIVRELNKSRAPNDLTTAVDMLTSQPFEADL